MKKGSNWQRTAELAFLAIIVAFMVAAIFWPLQG